MIGAQLGDWEPQHVFIAFAIPAALSAIAMVAMHVILKPAGNEGIMGKAVRS
jgi:hypothetical protein